MASILWRGATYPVVGETLFGRHSTCHVRWSDERISRFQARFWIEGGELWVECRSTAVDLRLGGEILSGPTLLRVGDAIEILEERLLIVADPSALDETAHPAAAPLAGDPTILAAPASGQPVAGAAAFRGDPEPPAPPAERSRTPLPVAMPMEGTYLGPAPVQAPTAVPPAAASSYPTPRPPSGAPELTFLGPPPPQRALEATIIADLSGGGEIPAAPIAAPIAAPRLAPGAALDGRPIRQASAIADGWTLLRWEGSDAAGDYAIDAAAVANAAARRHLDAAVLQWAKLPARFGKLAVGGIVADRPWLRLRLPAPGAPLPDVLDRCGRLPPEIALTAVAHLARALRDLHAAGIAHPPPTPDGCHAGDDGELRVLPIGPGWLGQPGPPPSVAADVAAALAILRGILGLDPGAAWPGAIGRDLARFMAAAGDRQGLGGDLGAFATACDEAAERAAAAAWPPRPRGSLFSRILGR